MKIICVSNEKTSDGVVRVPASGKPHRKHCETAVAHSKHFPRLRKLVSSIMAKVASLAINCSLEN